MDSESTLDTVDNNADVIGVAQRMLGHDARVEFHVADGAEYLAGCDSARYDIVYADAWPGKCSHVDEALALLRPGGIYFIDDLLPQPNWPPDHAEKVAHLIANLEKREEFTSVRLAWASGLMMLVRCRVP